MSGRTPRVRGRQVRRGPRVRRASAGLSPARAGALLGMIVTAGAIYGVAGSSAFAYERLEIDPLRYTDEAAVAAVLDVAQGENLFQVRTEPLADQVRELPTVLGASVEVSLPDTLVVHVIERTPILVWRVGDASYLVDATGTLFAAVGEAFAEDAADLHVIRDERDSSTATFGAGTRLDPVDFDAATRLAAIVPSDVGSTAGSFGVRISTANGFVLFTRPDTWVAVFGHYTPTLRPPDLIPEQVRLLRSLLAQREDEVGRVILAGPDDGTYIPRATPAP